MMVDAVCEFIGSERAGKIDRKLLEEIELSDYEVL